LVFGICARKYLRIVSSTGRHWLLVMYWQEPATPSGVSQLCLTRPEAAEPNPNLVETSRGGSFSPCSRSARLTGSFASAPRLAPGPKLIDWGLALCTLATFLPSCLTGTLPGTLVGSLAGSCLLGSLPPPKLIWPAAAATRSRRSRRGLAVMPGRGAGAGCGPGPGAGAGRSRGNPGAQAGPRPQDPPAPGRPASWPAGHSTPRHARWQLTRCRACHSWA
jgi:hypothetical protein